MWCKGACAFGCAFESVKGGVEMGVGHGLCSLTAFDPQPHVFTFRS